MVKGGHNRLGDTLHCALRDGDFVEANIVEPTFYDVDNEAQKANVEDGSVIESAVRNTEWLDSTAAALAGIKRDDRKHVGVTLQFRQKTRLLTLVGSSVENQNQGKAPSLFESLPMEPNTWSSIAGVQVCWIGPSLWLTLERIGEARTESSDFVANLPSDLSVIDTTGAYAVVSLSGPSVGALLKKACAYDFHESVFSTKCCVRTTFAKTQALVIDQQKGFIDLVVRRSYSDYVTRWIADASREFGFRLVN